MKTAQEFEQFYQNSLLPILKPLEELRLKTRNKIFLLAIPSLAAFFILLFTVGGFAVVVIAIFIFACIRIIKKYKNSFKDFVIAKIAKFVESSLSYVKDSFISETVFDESELFHSSHNRYNGDDYVSGSVNGTAIEFSELDVRKVEGSGKNRHEHIIFRGIFFIADFNKSFKGETFVLPDVAEKFLGRIGTFFQSKNPSRNQLIKLENPEFEKEFVVYGDDQVEARYILSTSLMERILRLRRKTGKGVHIAFKNFKIYIALSHPPIFEPKIFTTILDFEPIRNYFDDLCLILGIVEDLNLNTRIWTKA